MLLRIVLGGAVDGDLARVESCVEVVAPLHGREPLLDGRAFCVPFAHPESVTPQRGPVAQLVEQGTFNPKVAGSSPARPIGMMAWMLELHIPGSGPGRA